MDKITTICPFSMEELSDAVVVWANWFQFGSGEYDDQYCVESRMLLWCVSGRGRIRVNGHAHTLVPGYWIFLPWRRRIVYEADPVDPFLVGGIHIIPHHRRDVPVLFTVNHTAPPPTENPARFDWPPSFLPGSPQGHLVAGDTLSLLTSYVVEKFQHEKPATASMRRLARMVIEEIEAALNRAHTDRPLPGQIRRIQEYVRHHLTTEITAEKLAQIGGCSVTSLHRLFWKHTGLSPGRWVAQTRMEHAARLLRTSTLAVCEIGRQVGLPDQFHFSRFFRRHSGVSPSAYRKTHATF